MKRYFNRICALLLLFTVFVFSLLSGCGNDERNSEIKINNFAADEIYFIAGEESTITFTAHIEGAASTVSLCTENNTVVGTMQDDGANGDVTASDGTYTCVLTEIAKNKETKEYYVKIDNNTSESLKIYFFTQPNESSREEVIKIQDEMDRIESSYLDSNGYVPLDKISGVLSEIEDYAKEMYDTGNAISYEKTDCSVVVKLSNGMTIVYSPEIEGTYGISSDTSATVYVYQPYYEWVLGLSDNYIELPKGINKEADLLSAAAENVSDTFSNYQYSVTSTYRDSDVSLSSIKSFGMNQIILWQGHGTYGGSELHSLIYTGSEFDWDAYFWDPVYFLDCCQNRIVDCSGMETFSYKYVDKYCKKLDNSLIYLGPCKSGYDDVLAKAFLNKGAGAVVANTDTILCLYGDIIEYTTISLMAQINPKTNNYYSLEEALIQAKSLYGEDDSSYKNGVGAVPTIFGGTNANNYRLGNYVPINVDNFSLPDSLTLTIGQTDLITPTIEPENAEGYTIKWISSDESVVTVNPTGESGIVASHAKGTATITAELESGGKTITRSTEVRVASKGRDTVLVLDVSGSMSGSPMTEMKKSAIKFCDDLLTDEYNNRVGIVCFDNTISTYDLTNDINELTSYINGLSTGGATNMGEALSTAENLLDNSNSPEHIKNIVVMADGLPNRGKTSSSGSSGIQSGGKYADAVVDTAKSVMQKYNMYSLGFFHSLSSYEYDDCSLFMSKLTNMPDGYHEVQEAEDLQFEFGDIATNITDGSKIVINIACPVDVAVSYNGETLSSASESFNEKTSFGTLQLLGADKDIKVLSLDSDKQYDVKLNGTDDGKMDYSVNYVNADDEIIDYRNFSSVPITKTTIINSSTENSTTVNLNIDNDGDGKVDVIWEAGNKGEGKVTVDNTETTAPVTTAPETTIASSTAEVIGTIEKTQDSDSTTLIIIVISICSLLAIGLIVLMVVTLSRKNKVKEDIEEIPIIKSERAITEGRKTDSENQEKEDKKTVAEIEIISGSMAGMRIPLSDGEILTLGKNPSVCQVVFTHDYTGVSRMHCTVSFSKSSNKFFVTDSSLNGTYFTSKRRLEKGKRTLVNSGEIIYLSDENCAIRLLCN